MNVFVYEAALLCERCGQNVRTALTALNKAPTDPEKETSYDSDDFPKGPFADGGGEADSPQHCNACLLFLQNPLTSDGHDYVIDLIKNYISHKKGNPNTLKFYAEFYDITLEDLLA